MGLANEVWRGLETIFADDGGGMNGFLFHIPIIGGILKAVFFNGTCPSPSSPDYLDPFLFSRLIRSCLFLTGLEEMWVGLSGKGPIQ